MAQLPQHVVGDVHHVADGPEPARAQAGGHPRRRRAHAQAADDAHGIARAEVGRLHAHARQPARRLARLAQRDLRRPQPRARERRQLARHAQDRQAIGPVGRDLDLEHALVQAEVRDEVGAERRAVHGEQAGLVLLAQPQLALGAQHAVRLHPAELGHPDGLAARQHRARRRECRPHADLRVRRAAHDGKPRPPGAHAYEQQPVAVALAELPLDRLDLADHHAPEVGRDRCDARHLQPRVDEPVGRVLRGQPHVDELAHPVVWNLHRARRTAGGNGGRCRRTDAGRRRRTSASRCARSPCRTPSR